MTSKHFSGAAIAAALAVAAAGAEAQALHSMVSISTADQQPAAEQPAGGIAVTYPVTISDGALTGCTEAVQEALFPGEDQSWGIYQLTAEVSCADGGFDFASAGAWDANGFRGAGAVVPGSGTGRFDGLEARIAQVGGTVTPIEGTEDYRIAFELIVAPVAQ